MKGTLPQESEGPLVQLAQSGDREAFAVLVDRHGARFVNLAGRLCGSADLAAELVQEALLKAWRNLRRLRDPSAFYPWVARILVNLAKNHFRHQAVHGRHIATDDFSWVSPDTPLSPHHQQAPGPVKQLQDRELGEAVDCAVNALPEKYRLPLILFSQDGLSHQEVGDILDIPAVTVRWRVHHARNILKEWLAPYMND